MKAAVGRKFYGKIPVTVTGRDVWDRHDATATWSDGGEIRQLLDRLAPELERVVAQNAAQSVAEYAELGEAAVRGDLSGEVMVGLRLWNDNAAMIIEIPLKKLLLSALTEMRNGLAVDPNAQTAVSNLVDLGRQMHQLAGPATPQVASPLPAAPGMEVMASGRGVRARGKTQ